MPSVCSMEGTAKGNWHRASKYYNIIQILVRVHLSYRNNNNIIILFDPFSHFYSPIYDAYCRKHYANGHCDYGCNNEECNWDGLDCDREPPSLAEGVISVVVRMDMQTFRSNVVAFLRDIGHELRTTLRVKQDELGNDMIYPWKRERDPGMRTNFFGRPTTIYTNTQSGVIAYLEIDNRKCTVTQGAVCFPSANEAAEYLAATASKHSLSRNFPIEQVRGVVGPQGPEYPDAPTNYKYVFIGIVIVVLGGLLVGVLVTAQRKRAVGVTWFPEGFLRTNSGSGQRRRSRRRGPDGQEMRNLNKQPSVNCMDLDVGNGRAQQWSDDESDLPPSKRMRAIEPGYASDHTAITDYEETEPRMWTQQHLDAAEIRRPDAGVLTPPSLEHGQDVDARGPCGMTPLMVAAVRGGGLDTGEEEDESDGTAAVIADLVAQGADLNATTDKSGETSLHLAARYARADAAKRLLDAGADANSQDNTGRTPLHSAVAADAMGVFQILLRNRATNLNARMHDGTTPLILAARLATEGMVEDLINADADINAADNSGKTALHWAAAVNNVDAVNILLVHGANRDAQDDKDETPLFLAAREGSFEACKALLDTFANREITDHMDRLPRDVASERLHHDIVRLLDEHVPRSPQMVNVIPNGPLMGKLFSFILNLLVVSLVYSFPMYFYAYKCNVNDSILCCRLAKSPTTDNASHSDRLRSEASQVEETAKSWCHGESKQSGVGGRCSGGKAKTIGEEATGETRCPTPKPGDSPGS